MKKHCRIELDEYEQGSMLNALTLLRNQQLRDGRPTDPVNDLIEKINCLNLTREEVHLGFCKG